jgi:hypothetical protein
MVWCDINTLSVVGNRRSFCTYSNNNIIVFTPTYAKSQLDARKTHCGDSNAISHTCVEVRLQSGCANGKLRDDGKV